MNSFTPSVVQTVLIIGGGIAGVTAAESLRKISPALKIILIDSEEYPLYSRVLLPHYIKGKVPRAKVFLKTPEWYTENHIDWRPSSQVVALDHEQKIATLHTGEQLSYTQVILSTGTTPAPQVGRTLQTLNDADQIVDCLPGLEAMDILGGGFMACEFLNIAEKFQLPAKLYQRGQGFWNNALTPLGQQLLKNRLGHHPVTVHDISEAPLNNPQTFVGLGAPANIRLAEDLGLTLLNGGVRTSEFLTTPVKDVYVIGDVAAPWSEFSQEYLRVANWQTALTHGRAVASTSMGTPTSAVKPTAYATDLLGLSLIFMGDTRLLEADTVREKTVQGGAHIYYYRELQLVGATLIGDPLARQPILAALGQKYVPT